MTNQPESTGPKRWGVTILLASLFLSGVASIVNQVVWQRSMGIYLAGAESISSMIVVLVFMLGLGLGSHAMGRWAHRFRNPLRALAIVQLALAGVNAGVCYLLSQDISESVFAFQRMAISVGIPLRALYAGVAAGLLLAPCFLMGLTVPLASEGCQVQLRFEEKRLLSVLFFLNTLGAVLGALLTGFVILPFVGQQMGLLIAIGLNSLAGGGALVLARHPVVRTAPAELASPEPDVPRITRWLHPDLMLGFCLGFVSLGFEMYLFRIAALSFAPRPYVFAWVLTFFLLFWSLGVYAGKGRKDRIPLYLLLTAAAMALVPTMRALWCPHKADPKEGPMAMRVFLPCLIPCFGFGILFTQVATRFVTSWGRDVGKYFGYNTFGSCLGILAVTLIGFEFDPDYCVLVLAAGMALMLLYLRRGWGVQQVWRNHRPLIQPALGLLGLVLASQIALKMTGTLLLPRSSNVAASYYGKDGVIDINHELDMRWDGLWHSFLAKDNNHVGSRNWMMAVLPLLCHQGDRTPEVCVVGLGTGITAATLAKSELVDRVDAYEINEVLKRILRDYPEGTLRVAENPKVEIIWQDGRAGLALHDDRKYDLITQQPLYLVQSGSSCLLSKEYMQLVKSRLKPGGVYCIYSNDMDIADELAEIVRATAASVFKYGESFYDGYLLVVSDSPFVYDRQSIEAKLARDPPLAEECRSKRVGIDSLVQRLDAPRLNWECPYLITDDHPLVEYPHVLQYLVRRARSRQGK